MEERWVGIDMAPRQGFAARFLDVEFCGGTHRRLARRSLVLCCSGVQNLMAAVDFQFTDVTSPFRHHSSLKWRPPNQRLRLLAICESHLQLAPITISKSSNAPPDTDISCSCVEALTRATVPQSCGSAEKYNSHTLFD